MVEDEDIYKSVRRFNATVIRLGYILAMMFLWLTASEPIGVASLVGVIMSLGLVVFGKLRERELDRGLTHTIIKEEVNEE